VKEIVPLTLLLTSKGSGAHQSCLAAVGLLGEQLWGFRVEVVDTLQATTSHGWVATELAWVALTDPGLG
jgi:fatty acid-binding protein DegV